jgi:ribosomal protein S24E
MEIKHISKEFENHLFKRKEIEFEVSEEKTPSKKEATDALCKKFSKTPELVLIKKIVGRSGVKHFKISAFIYHSKKDMHETESFSKKEKEKLAKLYASEVKEEVVEQAA